MRSNIDEELFMVDEMVIDTRLFDLLEWLIPKAEQFPRVYRHTLTQRLMDAALDAQEAICSAHRSRGQKRKRHLEDADIALDRLRIYLRLAHRWHWLSDGQYQHVSRMVAETGRLLGGWIRESGRQRKSAPGP
jgi:hypothetical protein